VLQCVEMCCSVLLWWDDEQTRKNDMVSFCVCSMLQTTKSIITTCVCSVLQRVAVWCSVLQTPNKSTIAARLATSFCTLLLRHEPLLEFGEFGGTHNCVTEFGIWNVALPLGVKPVSMSLLGNRLCFWNRHLLLSGRHSNIASHCNKLIWQTATKREALQQIKGHCMRRKILSYSTVLYNMRNVKMVGCSFRKHLCICMCIYIDVWIYVYMYIYTCINIQIYMHIHIHSVFDVNIVMIISMCVYMYIHICLYLHILWDQYRCTSHIHSNVYILLHIYIQKIHIHTHAWIYTHAYIHL